MIILMEKTFKAVQCQKCRQILRKYENHRTLAEKSPCFFLVPSLRFQHFKHLKQNPKNKLMASFCSNYLMEQDQGDQCRSPGFYFDIDLIFKETFKF